MNLNKEKLGVLGGAGHFACNAFERSLLESFSKDDVNSDSDFPSLISINSFFPGISGCGVLGGDVLSESINQRIDAIKTLGGDKIIIACASAHPYVSKKNKTLVIDWISLGAKRIKQDKRKKVGVLASRSSIEDGVFSEALNQEEVEFVFPVGAYSSLCDQLIQSGMQNKFTQLVRLNLLELEQYFVSQGCDSIWLGCTDLYFIQKSALTLPSYNSISFMVDASQSYFSKVNS